MNSAFRPSIVTTPRRQRLLQVSVLACSVTMAGLLSQCRSRTTSAELAGDRLTAVTLTSISSAEVGKAKDFDRKFFEQLDLATLQGASDLSKEAFDVKWLAATASDSSPFLFFRSFPRAYFRHLSQIGNVYGPIGLCLGDAHRNNFGFIVFKEGVGYVANDLDDSGDCPIILDALRYFVSLRLADPGNERIPQLIEDYVDLTQGRLASVPALPVDYFPEGTVLKEKNDNILEKYSEKGIFAHDTLSPVTPGQATDLIQAMTKAGIKGKILDVAEFDKETGGSGGRKRFWFLLGNESGHSIDILELKQTPSPATTFGGWPLTLSRAKIVDQVWTPWTNPIWREIKYQGSDFVLRSRTKDDINFDKMEKKSKRSVVYTAQIGIMGGIHGTALKDMDEASTKTWLKSTSELLAAHWTAVYAYNRDNK